MDTSMFALPRHEKHNSLLKLKDLQSVLIILSPPLLKIEGNLEFGFSLDPNPDLDGPIQPGFLSCQVDDPPTSRPSCLAESREDGKSGWNAERGGLGFPLVCLSDSRLRMPGIN